VWHEAQMPRNAQVTLQNRSFRLNALAAGEQVRVELTEIRTAQAPLGN
jgi:hypothetical protein